MNKHTRSRKSTAKQSARLGAYFAAGVGASMAATSEAAIVNINIGPSGFNIGGTNGGISPGGYGHAGDFPFFNGGSLWLYNGFDDSMTERWGLAGSNGLWFAGTAAGSPTFFAPNQSIDYNSYFGSAYGLFKFDFTGDYYGPVVAPATGPGGAYIGFRVGGFPLVKYGWLEVLWNGSDTWQILSGAYEDDLNTPILAGATATAPIPEPGTWAALAVLAGGAAFARWRKRKAA